MFIKGENYRLFPMTIVTHSTWLHEGEMVDVPQYFEMIGWNSIGDTAYNNLTPGSKLYIEAELRSSRLNPITADIEFHDNRLDMRDFILLRKAGMK